VSASAQDQLARVSRMLAVRWPESTMEPSLDRIAALVDLLGQPQRAYPVIHLTGTNGKTSTARMVDALLRAFGLRTGRYTSPHLQSITERICLDGEPLPAERFVATYDDVAPYVDLVDARGGPPMSFFEVLTGMAYAVFADAPVDVAVVEVGLGGVWDATNVADGTVAVVTPIAIDHTRLLGSTVDAIATEKAGIVKPGATAVFATQPAEAAAVLARRAAEVGARAAWEGTDFGVLKRRVAVGGQQLALRGLRGEYEEVFLPLFGGYQAGNAACALAAVEAFLAADIGGALDVEAVRAGFATVSSPGRLEPVRTAPTVIVDAAHNPAGMAATVAALAESFGLAPLVVVLAVLADKDVSGMLQVLEPAVDAVVVTENSSPRRLPVDDLAAQAVAVFGTERVEVAGRLDDAVEAAVRLVEESTAAGGLAGSGILITGSVVTAGEARTLLVADR